jgi:hypothetical protein
MVSFLSLMNFTKNSHVHVTMELKNGRSKPLDLFLEPNCEFFTIQPGQQVEIHATVRKGSSYKSFIVVSEELSRPSKFDTSMTVFAPGDIDGFIDTYVVLDGVRLAPDDGLDRG